MRLALALAATAAFHLAVSAAPARAGNCYGQVQQVQAVQSYAVQQVVAQPVQAVTSYQVVQPVQAVVQQQVAYPVQQQVLQVQSGYGAQAVVGSPARQTIRQKSVVRTGPARRGLFGRRR
jgi:hypothetical protein